MAAAIVCDSAIKNFWAVFYSEKVNLILTMFDDFWSILVWRVKDVVEQMYFDKRLRLKNTFPADQFV